MTDLTPENKEKLVDSFTRAYTASKEVDTIAREPILYLDGHAFWSAPFVYEFKTRGNFSILKTLLIRFFVWVEKYYQGSHSVARAIVLSVKTPYNTISLPDFDLDMKHLVIKEIMNTFPDKYSKQLFLREIMRRCNVLETTIDINSVDSLLGFPVDEIDGLR